jgi:hypothetical protein
MYLCKKILEMNNYQGEEDYIEPEEGNEHIKIENPFNPNDININIVTRTIGQLIDMLRYDEIIIPPYQRLPNLWNVKQKSRFIESLMLNLPIPLFYFDEAEDKKWRVIDGLQRMSALEHFVLSGSKDKTISGNETALVLDNLEFKTEYNGRKWDGKEGEGLPRDIQRRIEVCQVTINLIQKGTPDEVKYSIFSRINQGGIELKAQEIRTALFQGYKVDFLKKLISSDTTAGRSFILATNASVPSRRQEDLDFATRFISFYILGYEKYEPDMDLFQIKGTKSIPNETAMLDNICQSFQEAMQLSYDIFGQDAFRKITNSDSRWTRINKALFEVMSVYFAKLNPLEKEKLLSKRNDFKHGFIELQRDEAFWNAITTGTASKDSVRKRHELFKELLNKFIK